MNGRLNWDVQSTSICVQTQVMVADLSGSKDFRVVLPESVWHKLVLKRFLFSRARPLGGIHTIVEVLIFRMFRAKFTFFKK